MKRLTVLLFALAVFLGGSASAFAQVFSNICWSVNGFPVKTSFTVAGSAAGSRIYDVDGFGTSTNVPIKGTYIVPPTGDARFSFLIQAASPSQHAVVHELTLDRNTGNGTGYWRWFDSSNSGSSTAMIVACLTAEALKGGDSASQGLQD